MPYLIIILGFTFLELITFKYTQTIKNIRFLFFEIIVSIITFLQIFAIQNINNMNNFSEIIYISLYIQLILFFIAVI